MAIGDYHLLLTTRIPYKKIFEITRMVHTRIDRVWVVHLFATQVMAIHGQTASGWGEHRGPCNWTNYSWLFSPHNSYNCWSLSPILNHY